MTSRSNGLQTAAINCKLSMDCKAQPAGDGGWCAVWWSDAAGVAVRFQSDGTAAEKGLWGGIEKGATLGALDRLLWRLGL
jgi:hypothetical protein